MTDTRNSWQWAIDKLRQETHCTASVLPRQDGAILIFIEEPDGRSLFKGECHGEHIVQFVIEAVRVAYMEEIA